MSAGLPVINTRLPTTVPLVARDGREGLTVEPGDEAALAAAITRLLNDPDFARQLGTAGQQRARRRHGWRTFADEVARIYQETIDDRPAPCRLGYSHARSDGLPT
jgi:rhamnosyl/mannosyltransferase